MVVAFVLDLDELAQDPVAFDPHATFEWEQHAVVRLGRSKPVDTRHARDDDDVPSLEQRSCGRQPHAVDLVVDRRFLLDVRVGRWHVRFGLVVVVVAHEVLDGVSGEQPLELLIELCRQGLVVRHHEAGSIDASDHLGHGEGLPGPGDAEQHLVAVAAVESLGQLRDRSLLITMNLEVGDQ